MITTVTLNAAIDKTYFIPSFKAEHVNRVQQMYSEPGGKGINVAKVLHALGVDVTATGYVGGYTGQFIAASLKNRGVKQQFVSVEGESRLCLNVIDETGGTQTEILETGPVISKKKWEELTEEITSLAGKSEFVVFSGSLPRGLSDDAYALLTRIVHQHQAKPVVDTSGSALIKALAEKPFMIKPNRDELAAVMKKDRMTESDILHTMESWSKQGISLVVVSLGRDGALVAYEGEYYKVVPPAIEAVNPVGCGDAMVAGMVAGLSANLAIEETLALSTAAAAANALERQAGCVSLDTIDVLRKKVRIWRL